MAQPTLVREFEPLIKAARPTLYQSNAFRLLGLEVDSEAFEISRRVQKIEMVQRFGGQNDHSGILPLPALPSVSLLRDARQRLGNPESRLIEEFFWFWPQEPRGSKNDTALQAMLRGDLGSATDTWLHRAKKVSDTCAIHNLAILFHTQALDSLNTQSANGNVPEAIWIRAWKYWRMLTEYDPFWGRLATRIEELDDPRFSASTCDQIRRSLPSAILQIDLALAISAAEADQFARATEHLKIARESGFPPETIRQRTEQSLSYIRTRIDNLCADAEAKVSEQVDDAPKVIGNLVTEAKPQLEILNYLVGGGNRLRDAVHDHLAQTSRGILIAFGNKTEDWTTCEQLFAVVRPLAVSESLRRQIADDVETVERNAAWKRVWANLKPISSAPSLGRVNGIGFAIYGKSDYEPHTSSYAATYYFTVLFVPLFPIRRYRVIPTQNGYRFLGKVPLRAFDKWHLGIAIGLILIWLFSLATDSGNSTSGASPPSTSYSGSTAMPSSQTMVEPNQNGSGTTSSATDVEGDSRYESLHQDIERNKARLASLSSQVDTCQHTLEDYRSRIDSDRQQLDQMESDSRAGMSVDETEYDNIRERHNSNVHLYNGELSVCRSLAEQHDTLVDQTNAQIREYNQLVGAK